MQNNISLSLDRNAQGPPCMEVLGHFSCLQCGFKSVIETKGILRLYLPEDYSIFRNVEYFRDVSDLDGLYYLTYICDVCKRETVYVSLFYKGKCGVIDFKKYDKELLHTVYCFYKYRLLFFQDKCLFKSVADRLGNMLKYNRVLEASYLETVFLNDLRLKCILGGFVGERIDKSIFQRVFSILHKVSRYAISDLINGLEYSMLFGIIEEDAVYFVDEFNCALQNYDFIETLRNYIQKK